MNNALKYSGWVLSLALLVIVILTYNGWNKANTQLRVQADNYTASYNNLVLQNTQRDAQWQATLDTTLAASNAQWQSSVNTTLNDALAARNAQWQASVNTTVNNALAARDAQWQASVNTTVNNAIAVRDAQWQAALNAQGVVLASKP